MSQRVARSCLLGGSENLVIPSNIHVHSNELSLVLSNILVHSNELSLVLSNILVLSYT